MKIFLVLSCLISLSFTSLAQNLKVNQAEMYYKLYRFGEANPIYKELIQKDGVKVSDHEEVYRHALVSSEKCRDYNFQYDVLGRISQSEKYTFDDAYSYFQLSLFLGFYDRAKEIMSSQIVVNSVDSRKMLLDHYKNGDVWSEIRKDTSVYKITNVDFNSGTGDFNAIYHPKGIAFSSARNVAYRKSTFDNSPYLNMYIYQKEDGKVEELKFLETPRHDGTAYYDSLNKVWYFSKNYPSTKDVNLTTTGLFIFDENTQTETAFTYNSTEFFLAQPFLSEDGKTLWFSSNRIGGFGKADIWYSTKTNDDWSEPVNAGNVINTVDNEMFPFPQKNKLYFSSNGHPGLGGLDLFSVLFSNEKASDLLNLGANLNSNGDDFSLVLDKTEKTGYFSSNRGEFIDNIYSVVINRLEFVYVGTIVADLNTEKIQAIPVIVKKEGSVISTIFADKDGKFEFNGEKNSSYSFEINQQEFESVKEDYSTVGKTASDSTFKDFVLVSNVDVAFTIVDEKTKQNLRNAKVEIVNKKTNEIISVTTNEKGLIELKLPRNNEFEVRVSHANYIDSKTSFSSVTKDKVIASTIGLNKIEVGAVLAIKDLNYDYNKWNIKPESKVELNKVVAFLKENPNVKIELSSHTDSRGLAEFNMNLSKKRNQSCIAYLVSKGVKKDRVIGKWYGESMLLNKCADDIPCSEEEHWKNRRTAIVVVSIE